MKRFRVILLLIFISAVGCNSVQKVMRTNVPGITDYMFFDKDIISSSESPFLFYSSGDNIQLPNPYEWIIGRRSNPNTILEDFLRRTSTVSFLVIRNDSILYENYFNGFVESTPSQVFSITKSLVSGLVGIAISDGYIESVHQRVAEYIPSFQEDNRKNITIEHLLNMTDGLNFSDYKTMHRLLSMYFHNNQKEYIDRIGLKHEPGEVFEYKSISTLLLGIVLEKAIGVSLAQYIEDKIWKPLGMEYTAAMMLDSEDGAALAYGGLVARARDLAKIGRLYLNNGVWDGEQIIPSEWVINTPVRDTFYGQYYNYNKAWWLDTYLDRPLFEKTDFFASGYAGQVLYINPEQNIIIVRQGKKNSGIRWGTSLSKLALMLQNGNSLPKEPEYLENNLLAGKYYNPVNGQLFRLMVEKNRLFLNDGVQNLELERHSKFCYVNRKEKVRIILNIENNIVNGLFLDSGSRYLTFFNRDIEFARD